MLGKNAAGRYVLCADGDGRLGLLLRPLLDDAQCVTASTGASALQQAQDHIFDLHVIGERLPDMSYRELCGRIRGFDSRTPILLCLHSTELSDGAVAALGAQGVIANPIDTVSAPRIIRHVLAFARQRSLEARADEKAAVVEELSERMRKRVDELERMTTARDLLFNDARLMAHAYEAFSSAGGTPADFKRMWPAVFSEARASALPPEGS